MPATSAGIPWAVTRRGFLKRVGAVGAGVAAVGSGVTAGGALAAEGGAAAPSTESHGPARQWAMVIDLRKCEGCVTQDKPPACVEACNAEHFVPAGQQWLRVFKVGESGGSSHFAPRPCMQCENAPCLNVCPVGATYRNREGVILVNHERCIGCRMCMAACPYGARSFNWDQPENPPGAVFAQYSPEYPVPHRRGTVEKCMLCAHRTHDGKLPACASACPMGAIYLAEMTQDVATNGTEIVQFTRFLADNSAFRLKEELGTRPRVWYLPGHGQEYGREADDRRNSREPRPWQELSKK
ncbi:MAG: 4Fe-4S dicluster domain-containing protein [Chloroflexota bacterium]|nr:MAG: 4Fe-4S dicluster domain-containing protein [Chloroflexota bacterium]